MRKQKRNCRMVREMMKMSNSSLVSYVRISPNRTSSRKNKIDRITIHHMAGNLSVETCGAVFAPTSRQASSNYGIGSDGRIGMYVEEKDRSWCSSSSANDNRAVTIEVADDVIGNGWHSSDRAMKSLVALCADICKRNGIARLNYTGNTNGNLTLHKWFAATDCPGAFLESRMSWIANEVNKILGGGSYSPIIVVNGKIAVDGSWGNDTTRKTQTVLGTVVDGIISNQPRSNMQYLPNAYVGSWEFKSSGYDAGSSVVRAMQRLFGCLQDGYFGRKSVIAMQTSLGKLGYYKGLIDGSMGGQTVRAWQTYLNSK